MKFAAFCQCALLRSCSVRLGLILLIALAYTSAATAQTILYVDDDAPPGGDGLSWASAFQHPQQALDLASSAPGPGYVVKVGQGRYVPTKRTDPNDPRSATFQLINDLSLEGGYAGVGATDPNAHDRDAFVTVLSGDNSMLHVTMANSTDATAVLDGLTISDGRATDLSEWPEATYHGAGMLIVQSNPTILRCRFINNAAGYGAAIYSRESSPTLMSCEFAGNAAHEAGGGIRSYGLGYPAVESCLFHNNLASTGGAAAYFNQSVPHFTNCRFENNLAEVAAGIFANGNGSKFPASSDAVLANCIFENNSASVGGGGVSIVTTESLSVTNCVFDNNEAGTYAGAGILVSHGQVVVRNCQFTGNSASFGAGAIATGNAELINCIFSRNSTDGMGGGVDTSPTAGATLVNCTISQNVGNGFNSQSQAFVSNCIMWGNTPNQINPTGVTCSHSNIQGGWSGPGSNNIDANPMFLQTGCDDLRLAFGSPCIDAGDNSALPPGTDTDLDGQPRIQNRIVDMGAYEGGHDPLPPMACEDDLDQGEYANMIPGQGTPSPAGHCSIFIGNLGGPDNASVTATELIDDPHPDADAVGFENFARTLRVETTLLNGQMFMFARVPFDEASLNGTDPMTADLTYFDTALNRWILAVEANTQDSPDHSGTVGDRFAQSGPTNPVLSTDLGDHGVFWNTTTHRGYVWANLDHASDFAAGLPLPLCPADCFSPPNGQVNLADLVSVLKAWGQTAPAAGAQDVNRNGVVDIDDLVAVITAWGACP